MSTPTLVWIVIYAVATLLFFSTAAVITVIGVKDLRDLLGRSDKTQELH